MRTTIIDSSSSPNGQARQEGVTKMVRRFSCLVLATAVTTGNAFANDENYGLLGQAVVAGFECATLAAHSKYRDEEIRLTSYGVSTGRSFVEAYRSGSVLTADLNRVDLILPMVLRAWSVHQKLDISVDFSVGGIYQEIWSRTTSDLGARTRKNKQRQSDYSVLAQSDFQQKNCTLVGK